MAVDTVTAAAITAVPRCLAERSNIAEPTRLTATVYAVGGRMEQAMRTQPGRSGPATSHERGCLHYFSEGGSVW